MQDVMRTVVAMSRAEGLSPAASALPRARVAIEHGLERHGQVACR